MRGGKRRPSTEPASRGRSLNGQPSIWIVFSTIRVLLKSLRSEVEPTAAREFYCSNGFLPLRPFTDARFQAASRIAPAAIAPAPPTRGTVGRSPNHHEKSCAKSTEEFRSVTIAPAPPRSRQ